MKLLVATTNPDKIREIRQILDGLQVDLCTLEDCTAVAEPEETGTTFAENARLKARYYHQATGLPTVAEDSGIEIEALGNLPGVQSARWQGTDYAVKFKRIYEMLRAQGTARSPARFVAAVAYAVHGAIAFETEGIVCGEIASEPRGTHGFGYDPIFFYPPFGRTLAELDDKTKSTVSHRGAAVRMFRDYLLAIEQREPGHVIRTEN